MSTYKHVHKLRDVHVYSGRVICVCLVMQKYKQLVSEGIFQDTLLEMYRWGKQHAWDPLALRNPPTPAAQ